MYKRKGQLDRGRPVPRVQLPQWAEWGLPSEFSPSSSPLPLPLIPRERVCLSVSTYSAEWTCLRSTECPKTENLLHSVSERYSNIYVYSWNMLESHAPPHANTLIPLKDSPSLQRVDSLREPSFSCFSKRRVSTNTPSKSDLKAVVFFFILGGKIM